MFPRATKKAPGEGRLGILGCCYGIEKVAPVLASAALKVICSLCQLRLKFSENARFTRWFHAAAESALDNPAGFWLIAAVQMGAIMKRIAVLCAGVMIAGCTTQSLSGDGAGAKPKNLDPEASAYIRCGMYAGMYITRKTPNASPEFVKDAATGLCLHERAALSKKITLVYRPSIQNDIQQSSDKWFSRSVGIGAVKGLQN